MTTDQRTPMNQGMDNPPISACQWKQLVDAINKTVSFFRRNQGAEGEWVAELEGDALLQSETIILLTFLGEEDSDLARGCARRLVETVLPDGGWEMYPGAGADVTNSVKAYFALKIMGHQPSEDLMVKTRQKILELGGAEKVNSFTRFYLALLGQIPYDQTPAVPPQMIFLPKWFPINIYAMSSWSRTIFVPLSIVSALQPVKKLPPERGIRELMTCEPTKWPPLRKPGQTKAPSLLSWEAFFHGVDRLLWTLRKLKWTPLRKRSIEKAKVWTLAHFRESDGPGAIYPPIIWAWVAFKALGYADDSPEVLRCRYELTQLVIKDADSDAIRLAPCKSPVWDTSLTMKALRLAGVPTSDPMIRRGEKWLLSQQARLPGDWNQNVKAAPGGWAFEYKNPFYPDNDDTAMALMVLAGEFKEGEINRRQSVLSGENGQDNDSSQESSEEKIDFAKRDQVEAGAAWLLAMQNKDGGWGAFDRGNTLELLCKVPFADHNAMIDPSTCDLTGRVLESMGRRGCRLAEGKKTFLEKCAAFMRRSQEADGSWFGRWGINYIYGTWQALTGLTAIGVDPSDKAIRDGANWLLACQQPCGGWGESADSYRDSSLKEKGEPTNSQTAWALMGLMAAGLEKDPAVARGIRFLIDNQRPDGDWTEKGFTGTGFPQVFYLKYHYYPVYFPLMALAIYASKVGPDIPFSPDSADKTTP